MRAKMPNLLPSDAVVADLLREHGEMSISDLAECLQITATAVRQRLGRLMDCGMVTREAVTEGRGRPRHRYSLTALGLRESGGNFADLAMALWEEIRAIPDVEIRRGLLSRIARRMAKTYGIEGDTVEEKMRAIAELFGQRRVPLSVDWKGELPVLTARCCPYPSLAEQDRGVCSMEKMMLSEMVGQALKLSECRLDGGTCCTFELSASLGQPFIAESP